PITVSEDFVQKIFQQNSTSTLSVDLETQTITINATGEKEGFEINRYKKTCMINGYDDIDYLLNSISEIEAYEKAPIP
ncbi:3-isopropylmalate dehydratase small subunit, partial [Ferruginibacter sp.]